MENEKKNTRTVRKTNVGPIIRYQSLSMPVLMLSEMQAEKDEEKINVEGDDEKSTTNAANETSDTVSVTPLLPEKQ